MISEFNSAAQKWTSLAFSWLLLHGHKLAAIAPDSTASCDNIWNMKEVEGKALFMCVLFTKEGISPPNLLSRPSLVAHWLKLGHLLTSRPISGKGDQDFFFIGLDYFLFFSGAEGVHLTRKPEWNKIPLAKEKGGGVTGNHYHSALKKIYVTF